mmetsp:Transcript_29332/g.74357  ORF Transcript_29332/g.74357 Transcript_29332/m.74357 type:complete len:209 (-) Transcript_29332:638-1264(-)
MGGMFDCNSSVKSSRPYSSGGLFLVFSALGAGGGWSKFSTTLRLKEPTGVKATGVRASSLPSTSMSVFPPNPSPAAPSEYGDPEAWRFSTRRKLFANMPGQLRLGSRLSPSSAKCRTPCTSRFSESPKSASSEALCSRTEASRKLSGEAMVHPSLSPVATADRSGSPIRVALAIPESNRDVSPSGEAPDASLARFTGVWWIDMPCPEM